MKQEPSRNLCPLNNLESFFINPPNLCLILAASLLGRSGDCYIHGGMSFSHTYRLQSRPADCDHRILVFFKICCCRECLLIHCSCTSAIVVAGGHSGGLADKAARGGCAEPSGRQRTGPLQGGSELPGNGWQSCAGQQGLSRSAS